MPRHYQKKKNNPYYLPHNVYMQVLYVVKDYERLVEVKQDILYEATKSFGVQTGPGDPTANKAIRLSAVDDRIHAVEKAIAQLPEEYRMGVYRNIVYGDPYPIIASESTWRRKKGQLAYYVANNLGCAI